VQENSYSPLDLLRDGRPAAQERDQDLEDTDRRTGFGMATIWAGRAQAEPNE